MFISGISSPAFENKFSVGTDVVRIQTYFFAHFYKQGTHRPQAGVPGFLKLFLCRRLCVVCVCVCVHVRVH